MRLMVTGSRTTLRVIVALALAQAVLGVLRALHWFQIGVDLSQSGLLLLPILGVVTLARGALVGTLALLYGLFSWAALTGKSWARPVGLLACGLNILAVLGLLRIIDSWAAVLFWLIAPVIVGAYLLRSDVPPPLRTTGRS